jgi:hypothetical protein
MDALFEMKTGSPVASVSLSAPRQGFVKVREAVDGSCIHEFVSTSRPALSFLSHVQAYRPILSNHNNVLISSYSLICPRRIRIL